MTPRCPHCHEPEGQCREEIPECRARGDDLRATAAVTNGSVCHCAACTGARRAEAFRGEREHPRRERGGR